MAEQASSAHRGLTIFIGRTALALCAALTVAGPAPAQTLKDLLEQRKEQRRGEDPADPSAESAAKSKPKLSPEEALEQAYDNLRSEEEAVWKAAEKKITKSWSRSGSASMDLLLQRGRDAIRRENWDAALEHLTDLVNLAPSFAEGWSVRASVYFRQNEYGLALADLGEAIAQDPRHFGAYAGLGFVFEQIDDAPRAVAAYRESLKIHPNLKTAREGVDRLAAKADGFPL